MAVTVTKIIQYVGGFNLTGGNSIMITVNGNTEASYTIPTGKKNSFTIHAKGTEEDA